MWIMGIFLFINVWGILFDLLVSWKQYIVKSVSFIMGSYFVYNWNDDKLTLKIKRLNAEYSGQLSGEELAGE